MIWTSRLMVVVCGLALVLSTGCASLRGETASDATEESTRDWEPETERRLGVDSASEEFGEAFRFSATELFTEASVSGTELYNSGPVVVTFVSPTCPISIAEGPALADAAESEADITYVFAHTGGERQDYIQFIDDADLYQENVIHIDDSDLAISNRFGVEIQPSSVLVGVDGVIRFTSGGLEHQGLTEAAELLRGNA